MIYLYSGTPGSGKSLHLAERLYHWTKQGRGIVTNFDFGFDKIKHRKSCPYLIVDNLQLNPDLLIQYSLEYFSRYDFREGQIKLVIDECQLLFNAREWNKKGRSDWLSFFTQHRKYGYDVYLVAQFDLMIDKQIRSLIEYEVIHRKVANFGRWGTFFNLLGGGKLFIAVTRWYPLKERTESEFFRAKAKYFNLYNTLKTFDGKEEVNGKKIIDRQTIALSD